MEIHSYGIMQVLHQSLRVSPVGLNSPDVHSISKEELGWRVVCREFDKDRMIMLSLPASLSFPLSFPPSLSLC